MNKIILGTAQFGMDYGINNKRGRIPFDEALEILKLAAGARVDILDTAGAYGESEETLGSFLGKLDHKWRIISKLPSCEYPQIEAALDLSLKKLNIPKLYGYLIHNFQDYSKNRKIWNKLRELRSRGRIEKIGFSLYRRQELESILKDKLDIDLIQVPFNIFDQRFKPYFSELNKLKIEVHVRSVFLQGLVFKKPDQLDNYFSSVKIKIEELNSLSARSKIPVFALCLNFALENAGINKVVVGIDSLRQLREVILIDDYLPRFNNDIFLQLSLLRSDEEKIILPFKWGARKEVEV